VWDQAGYGAPDFANLYHGHDGVGQFFRKWLAPFVSYYAHAEGYIDTGEAVVVRCRQGRRGRHSAVEVEMPYCQVYRLRDGRAVRIEVYNDEREALKAVGLEE
jgi:ketosteroid isomerase-like protein